MIHYHGTPITPERSATKFIDGRHMFFSYATVIPSQLEFAAEFASSLALDNGAFSNWRNGKSIHDYIDDLYLWYSEWLPYPNCDWVLIPDVIDGLESDNDKLLAEWPFCRSQGVPIWHLHESLYRLEKLACEWPRIALGSSGEYGTIGTDRWWQRVADAFHRICIDGQPITKVHGLRMLNPDIFTRFPFASADSCNVALHHSDSTRIYQSKDHKMNGLIMLHNIEKQQSATRLKGIPKQQGLFGELT